MDFLERLCNVPGVSGFEEEAQKLVYEELKPHCDDIRTDRMGNVIAVKRAKNRDQPVRKLMFAAHIDEIGAMVSHIDDEGFIRFLAVGGLDPRTLPSERVTIHGTKNGRQQVNGVIAPQSGWLGTDSDRARVFQVNELYIDTARSAAELRGLVEIGDVITFSATFSRLNDNVVMGRNFDDRMGVYCMVEAMKRITHPDVDVYAVSTVQEEVGVRGAPTAAHVIEPDIAIAIDGSLPSDTPYAKPEERQCELGKGTGIYIMDKRTIGNPGLIRSMVRACEENNIPYQRNLGGATDASAIQRAGKGAWATTIGAPTRYMHSTVQLCHLTDIEATTALLAAYPAYVREALPEGWE